MAESPNRHAAGQQHHEQRFRVSLTRLCLATGRLQLPFALRDRFPEGPLLAQDAERDATVHLYVRSAREIQGFEGFFAEHGLRVNDRVELVFHGAGDDLRIVACPSVVRSSVVRASEELGSSPRGVDDAPEAAVSEAHGESSEQDRGDLQLAGSVSWRDRILPHREQAASPSAASSRDARHGEASREPSAASGPLPRPLSAPQALLESRDGRPHARRAGDAMAQEATFTAAPSITAGIGRSFPSSGGIVSRFGSVTVRRLGSDAPPPAAPETTLDTPIPAEGSLASLRVDSRSGAADGDRVHDDPFDASWVDRSPRSVSDDAMLGVPPERAIGAGSMRVAATHAGASSTGVAEDGFQQEGPSNGAPPSAERDSEAPEEARPHPVQLSLFRDDPAAAPARRARTRRLTAHRLAKSGGSLTQPAARHLGAGRDLDARQAPAAHVRPPVPSPKGESNPAGRLDPKPQDLRARAVAWLTHPSRPVIVRLDALRDALGLTNEATLALKDELLRHPAPAMTLTELGPGRIRVAIHRTLDDVPV